MKTNNKLIKQAKDKYRENLVRETIEDFKQRQLERKPIEAGWILNMNFLYGNQYCNISSMGDVEDYSKQYFWQEREVYNHISPIIETRISRLSQIRPKMSVVPSTNSEQDMSTAKVSKNLINAIYHKLNISDKIVNCTHFSEVCGTGFYKVYWDNKKGKKLASINNDEYIYEGDIAVDVVSPFEIFPDSNTHEDVDDCMSIIHAKSMHKDVVKQIWGIEELGEDIDVYSLDNISNAGGLGYSATTNKVISSVKHDQVLVIEKYVAPTVDYPDGRLIIVAGKTLVYDGKLPYVNREDGKRGFPFIKQVSLKTPNSFFGSSIIERIIPVQRSYNAVKNRKHEYLNRLSMGILTVEDGSVDYENLEEEGLCPGKVLVYRQGSNAPKIMDNGSIPTEFKEEEEKLLSEFSQISGISDFMSNNQISISNASGVALELLMEQDTNRLNITAEQIKFAIKSMAASILKLYKQFTTSSRIAKVIGKDGSIEMFYFQKSDISSDDIIFETESEIGETKAQKRSLIFELLNAGLLYNEDGKMSTRIKAKTLEMLGFGMWDTQYDLEELHMKKAGKEHLSLINTNNIDNALEIDNHNLHIDEHVAFMLSEEYSKAVKLNPEIQDKILKHIKEHKNFLKSEE
ncbi:MAG: hypothetical protein E7359_00520 [Clostridiales bacterium]|nr:hypothetical protein [Clostridiales bacterium]